MVPILFKITFIPGLQDIVSQEISQFGDIQIFEIGKQEIYLDIQNNIQSILSLKSVLNVYVVKRDNNLNPSYISNHKSILGELIEKKFKRWRYIQNIQSQLCRCAFKRSSRNRRLYIQYISFREI